MAATLLVVSFLVFLAFAVIPGGPRHFEAGHGGNSGKGGSAAGGNGTEPPASRAVCELAGRDVPGRSGNILQLQHACNGYGGGKNSRHSDFDIDGVCHDGSDFHTAGALYGQT